MTDHNISTYAYFYVDKMLVMVVGNSYSGSPVIGYAPDILIVPKAIIKQYKDCFTFLNKKHSTKIVRI